MVQSAEDAASAAPVPEAIPELAAALPARPGPASRRGQNRPAAAPAGAGFRLLLADGRVGLGAALTVAFGGRLLAVRASTTEEVLWCLQEGTFDLVVVEHGGPGLDAVAVLRAVRAHVRPCPAMVVTSAQDARALRELASLGVPVLPRRPGAVAQLVERIACAVDGAAGHPARGRRPSPHVLRVIEHLGQDYATARPATVAAALGITYGHLEGTVREETGLTLGDWIVAVRVEASKDLLRRGQSVAAVADSVGFFDASHLTRCFQARVGCTPGTFRHEAPPPATP